MCLARRAARDASRDARDGGGDAPEIARGDNRAHVFRAEFDESPRSFNGERVRGERWLVIHEPVEAVAFGGREIAWCYAPTRDLVELVQVDDGGEGLRVRGEGQ